MGRCNVPDITLREHCGRRGRNTQKIGRWAVELHLLRTIQAFQDVTVLKEHSKRQSGKLIRMKDGYTTQRCL